MRVFLPMRATLMGLFGLFGLIGNAWAINIGTINVTGKVSTGTCSALISGSADHTVALDTVSTTALAVAGNTAAPKTFTISLTGCDLVGNKNVVPYFLAIGSSINTAGRLKNMYGAGAATNVELQMLNASTAVMDLSKGSGSQGAGVVNIPTTPNGTGSVTYTLRYYAAAAATGGLVSSSMTWGVDYN